MAVLFVNTFYVEVLQVVCATSCFVTTKYTCTENNTHLEGFKVALSKAADSLGVITNLRLLFSPNLR